MKYFVVLVMLALALVYITGCSTGGKDSDGLSEEDHEENLQVLTKTISGQPSPRDNGHLLGQVCWIIGSVAAFWMLIKYKRSMEVL